jgi:hypothetical protein
MKAVVNRRSAGGDDLDCLTTPELFCILTP